MTLCINLIMINNTNNTAYFEKIKLKKTISFIDELKGNGTSLITLVLNPNDKIHLFMKKINEELGTASNIKSRTVRQNVISALTSANEKLKAYNKTPDNGLVIFAGIATDSSAKEKLIKYDIIPFMPIKASYYECGNTFKTEDLKQLYVDNDKFGFIIVDGNGSLFATLEGNIKKVLYKFSVDLPKKHGKGGQSSKRFARLRLERRHNYLVKIIEKSIQLFITDNKPNVKSLIIAGSADLKIELTKENLFDPRLKQIILTFVDISYGDEIGLNQAIDICSEDLSNVRIVEEKKVLQSFTHEIILDSGKYAFGIEDTIFELENGNIDKLILYEDLNYSRLFVENKSTNDKSYIVVKSLDEIDLSKYDIKENLSLLEYLIDTYRESTSIELVSDKSSEGNQFVKGFGGIGGILRYKASNSLQIIKENSSMHTFNEDDFM